jgi:hypothetical protein
VIQGSKKVTVPKGNWGDSIIKEVKYIPKVGEQLYLSVNLDSFDSSLNAWTMPFLSPVDTAGNELSALDKTVIKSIKINKSGTSVNSFIVSEFQSVDKTNALHLRLKCQQNGGEYSWSRACLSSAKTNYAVAPEDVLAG